ncbi:MAG: hypothetical protein PUE73_02815 [Eubacteriales bacterium]|nr:hypothetical protein [Eubacteriales bacterium]
MKKLKKIGAMLMALVMTMTACSTVYAANETDSSDTETVEARYVVIEDADCSLSVSGISAKCMATLSTKSSKSLKIKMELQKKKSTGYETLQTWTASKTGKYLTMTESRNINLLCSYRLKTTFTARSETEVIYRYYN